MRQHSHSFSTLWWHWMEVLEGVAKRQWCDDDLLSMGGLEVAMGERVPYLMVGVNEDYRFFVGPRRREVPGGRRWRLRCWTSVGSGGVGVCGCDGWAGVLGGGRGSSHGWRGLWWWRESGSLLTPRI
ncbi:hypothetical protein NE237_025543 [Protea cynaroides]|uniref:Uncharacterized protein n=1 Tax=Protea cynaroides TaxID=273540 RepID=A0A9Q0H226_9MAGN|nr:hypothetical protein NE237_025543 [Protea cynaroides]